MLFYTYVHKYISGSGIEVSYLNVINKQETNNYISEIKELAEKRHFYDGLHSAFTLTFIILTWIVIKNTNCQK